MLGHGPFDIAHVLNRPQTQAGLLVHFPHSGQQRGFVLFDPATRQTIASLAPFTDQQYPVVTDQDHSSAFPLGHIRSDDSPWRIWVRQE